MVFELLSSKTGSFVMRYGQWVDFERSLPPAFGKKIMNQKIFSPFVELYLFQK